MPIIVVCPKCSVKLSAPDNAVGRKVKCPKADCGAVVAVPAPAPLPLELNDAEENPPTSPTPVPKRSTSAEAPKAKPAAREVALAASNGPSNIEVVEESPKPARVNRKRPDDDEVDDRPVRNRRRGTDDEDDGDARPQRDRRSQSDDDEDNARPPRNRRRQSHDVEDDGRPRKKQKKKQSSGVSPVFIGAIAGGAFLLLGGVGLAIYLWSGSSKDKDRAANSVSGGGSGGGGFSSTSKAPVPAGWVLFDEVGTGFKAYFPDKTSKITMGSRKFYEGNDLQERCNCGVVVVSPPNIPPDNKKVFGETTAKTFFDGIRIRVLSRSDATLAGLPATEYQVVRTDDDKGFEVEVSKGVFRVIVTDKQVIMASVGSKQGTPSPECVNGFFDNFELVDEGASPKAKPNGSPSPNNPFPGNPPPKTNGPPSTLPSPPSTPPSTGAGSTENLSRIQKLYDQLQELSKNSNEAINKCTDAATAQDAAKTLNENADRAKKLAEELKGIGPLTATERNEVKAKYSRPNTADAKAGMEAIKKIQALTGPKSQLPDAARKKLDAAYNAWIGGAADFGFALVGLMLPPKK